MPVRGEPWWAARHNRRIGGEENPMQPPYRKAEADAHAENIRDQVITFVATDNQIAAEIRKESDDLISMIEQFRSTRLPRLSQVQNWQTTCPDDTRQYMRDAAQIWRAAGQDHNYALSLLNQAIEAGRKGLQVDAVGLRQAAESLRSHAAQTTPIEQLQGDPIQATITACNEAIGRINENHAVKVWLCRLVSGEGLP